MGFSRFRLEVVIRTLLLVLTLAGLVFLVLRDPPLYAAAAVITLLAIIQIWSLIGYTETVAREVTRLLQAIRSRDFTQNFGMKRLGSDFEQLADALKQVNEDFRDVRAQKESHDHYLQSVVRQVSTGLLSFNRKGDIRLLNDAAANLLNTHPVHSIYQLKRVDADLPELLQSLQPGDRKLIQLGDGEQQTQIALHASGLTLRGEHFTMVSLQDIGRELDHERLQNELKLARQVQQQLFPHKPPVIAGVDVAGHCIPARETGGDYFDWLLHPDGRVSMIIGDVSGKGMAAAFYMTLCKGVCQTLASSNVTTRDMVRQINIMLSDMMEANRFVSVFMGTLDPGSCRLTYCRAGHNPPLLIRSRNGQTEWLQARGLALGVQNDTGFSAVQTEATIQLYPGDVLVCYTDGITEAMNRNGEQFGTHRLEIAAKEQSQNSAEDILQGILRNVQAFVGDECAHDDMTLIVHAIREPS